MGLTIFLSTDPKISLFVKSNTIKLCDNEAKYLYFYLNFF